MTLDRKDISEPFSRGSEWRKWDLHVHSPASFQWSGTKKLGDMNPDEEKSCFEKMVEAINNSECAVFGIMDYWTFDGYLALKRNVKQHNLNLKKQVFPGIELRVEAPVDFRLNIHVLFEEDVSDSTLAEFKSRLHLLDNGQRSLSDDALADFGKRMDAGKAAHHGIQNNAHKSDDATALRLGAMTAKVSRQSLFDAVKYVGKERCLVILPYDCSDGLEKLDWKSHGADDLFFLRFADVFETRSEGSIDLFLGRKTQKNESYFDAFQEAIGGKPKPIVSGSDAHRFEDYGCPPGEKCTWIKANPTFLGLRQTLVEPGNRVFVGRLPAKVSMVASHKTKYIRSLEIKKCAGSSISEKWFDNKLSLNSELVAIIGNKGGGKSALADIFGMLGNSSKHDSFSFLNLNKFRHKKTGKADKFEATIEWESGKKEGKRLDAGCVPSDVESVRYIPQSYLEKVCNEGDVLGTNVFESELEQVIFSHISAEERLGCDSLQRLVMYRTDESYRHIDVLRGEVNARLKQIVDIEEKLSAEYKKKITSQLSEKSGEIKAHEDNKPKEVKKPEANIQDTETQKTIDGEKDVVRQLSEKIEAAKVERKAAVEERAKLQKAENLLGLMKQRFEQESRELQSVLAGVTGLKISDLVSLQLDVSPIATRKAALDLKIGELQVSLEESSDVSLVGLKRKKEEGIVLLSQKMDEPNKKFQEYLAAYKKWQTQKEDLVGEIDKPGTQRFLANTLAEIDSLPQRLSLLEAERDSAVVNIHEAIIGLEETYRELYRPVQDFIDSYKFDAHDFKVSFDVSVVDNGFASGFFDFIARNKAGSFCGREDADKLMSSILRGVDFASAEDVSKFCKTIQDHLRRDHRVATSPEVVTQSQLRDGKSVIALYEYIFSLDYLRPKYELRLNGKTIRELSPGERGSLLLVFYLLVDKDDRPLIIDQPEENLDNQTVFNVMVPSIKRAKELRQIIMVTHNPNLAVVCDAEQLICTKIHKEDGNRVEYQAGAIESPSINRIILDVLEGTRPAFENRDAKYHSQ